MTFSVVVAVTLVNLFYPEWTGGWSTGPRLLVPSIPFAMLPVAALLAGDSRATTAATIVAARARIGRCRNDAFVPIGRWAHSARLTATHSFKPSGQSGPARFLYRAGGLASGSREILFL